MSNERFSEFAYADVAKGSKGFHTVSEVNVMTIFEAIGYKNVNALVQLLELCAGGIIQVFEFSEITDCDLEGVRREEWARAHQMEAEVIGTVRDFLQTRLAMVFDQIRDAETCSWIKLLVGLIELEANGVNQEGDFALSCLQSLENLICSCVPN